MSDCQKIKTADMYPNGEYIYLFRKTLESGYDILSDQGETIRWLKMQTCDMDIVKVQVEKINAVCKQYGVRFKRGVLYIRIHPGHYIIEYESIINAILQISHAY